MNPINMIALAQALMIWIKSDYFKGKLSFYLTFFFFPQTDDSGAFFHGALAFGGHVLIVAPHGPVFVAGLCMGGVPQSEGDAWTCETGAGVVASPVLILRNEVIFKGKFPKILPKSRHPLANKIKLPTK